MRRLIRGRPYNEVTVTTGAGHGSISTKIRRIETAHTQLGTAISVVHSATLGSVFTINATGIYSITYTDYHTAQFQAGISRNSTQLTTNLASITASNILVVVLSTNIAAATPITAHWAGKLLAGDIIRPHSDGSMTSADVYERFTITKIA